jgi:hypothetical protein
MARKGLACRFMAFNTPIAIDFDLHQRRCLCLPPFSIAMMFGYSLCTRESVPWQLIPIFFPIRPSEVTPSKSDFQHAFNSMLTIQTVAKKAIYTEDAAISLATARV